VGCGPQGWPAPPTSSGPRSSSPCSAAHRLPHCCQLTRTKPDPCCRQRAGEPPRPPQPPSAGQEPAPRLPRLLPIGPVCRRSGHGQPDHAILSTWLGLLEVAGEGNRVRPTDRRRQPSPCYGMSRNTRKNRWCVTLDRRGRPPCGPRLRSARTRPARTASQPPARQRRKARRRPARNLYRRSAHPRHRTRDPHWPGRHPRDPRWDRDNRRRDSAPTSRDPAPPMARDPAPPMARDPAAALAPVTQRRPRPRDSAAPMARDPAPPMAHHPAPPSEGEACVAAWLASIPMQWFESAGVRPPAAVHGLPATVGAAALDQGQAADGAPSPDAAGLPANATSTTPRHSSAAALTCECNLAPLCRAHHQTKQAPGWQLRQLRPGVLAWTTPSGAHLHQRPNRLPGMTPAGRGHPVT